jgi:hypothetical protein
MTDAADDIAANPVMAGRLAGACVTRGDGPGKAGSCARRGPWGRGCWRPLAGTLSEFPRRCPGARPRVGQCTLEVGSLGAVAAEPEEGPGPGGCAYLRVASRRALILGAMEAGNTRTCPP